MRKLEYLRSAVRKCSTIEEVEKIDLPDDFRLSDDIGDCPNLAAIPVEKNGNVWLRIFITHSRIVERKLLLRDSDFTFAREERMSETYMVPISNEFKLESPIKSDSTKDYSNWGITKEAFTSKGLSGVTLSSHHQDSVFGCHPRMSYPLIKL